MIRLVFPSKADEIACLDFIKEHYKNNEMTISGGAGMETFDSYNEWLGHVIAHHNDVNIPENRVPATTFLAYDGDELIGVIDIRHRLNEYLENYGGHIGYGVRPSKRRQGYAKKILNEGLKYCKTKLNLSWVLITCDEDNIGSNKTILANNGLLIDKIFNNNSNKYTNRYKIKL